MVHLCPVRTVVIVQSVSVVSSVPLNHVVMTMLVVETATLVPFRKDLAIATEIVSMKVTDEWNNLTDS